MDACARIGSNSLYQWFNNVYSRKPLIVYSYPVHIQILWSAPYSILQVVYPSLL